MKSRYHLLLLLGIVGWSSAAAAAPPRKLVIDCDPGVDDALALIMAIQHGDFEIVGITTVFGNASLDQGTKNALRIVELSGKNIPVYRGAAKPLTAALRPPPDFVHGKDGLGNTAQPEPSLKCQDKPAAQFLAEVARAHPGEITILAIGRLTNLAQAVKADATFPRNIGEVVVMGGALHVPGNVSPCAEANVSGDPHAADLVFAAPWKVTIIGLDVTTKVRLNEAILSRVKQENKRFGAFAYAITRFYEQFHRDQEHVPDGFYVHDPSAVVYLVAPEIFKVERGPVRVVVEGIATGQTIMATYDYHRELAPWKGLPVVTAAVEVDREKYQKTAASLLLGDGK
jgi:inosine-uridine nucleoside N-ribohydrolase